MIVTVWKCLAGHETAITDAEIDLSAANSSLVRCHCGEQLIHELRDGAADRANVEEAHLRLQQAWRRWPAPAKKQTP